MLIEKEVIRDGTYWYVEEGTGLPRKLVVTPESRKHWHDQGNAMLSAGIPVPVPYEHDFEQHPMTPKEKLLNNAGEVRAYTLKGDKLFSTVDVQDPEVKNKIGTSIRWTSPWFSSFTDGDGKQWNNVISHLALTTRPRINTNKQQPFGSIAAALSMATETQTDHSSLGAGASGFCLSRAGYLLEAADPAGTKHLRPAYPVAFSLWGGGIKLSDGDAPPKKSKKPAPKKGPPKSDGGGSGKKPPVDGASGGAAKTEEAETDADDGSDEESDEFGGDGDSEDGDGGMMDPLMDASGDVGMEELLCDLLRALGVPMPEVSNESEFKRHLYEAAMCKITELASAGNPNSPQNTAKAKIPGPQGQQNPLIGQVQQEQQPMYMSLEDINKLPDPMKGVALAMYAENQKLRTELDSNKKVTDSLRDAKLKEASQSRVSRVALLSRLSPRVKVDLEAMLAVPGMALSMGDGGAVVDPMEQTLTMLEKGLSDLPRLLTTDQSALSLRPQPQDADVLTDERTDELADELARQMGCGPTKKAS